MQFVQYNFSLLDGVNTASCAHAGCIQMKSTGFSFYGNIRYKFLTQLQKFALLVMLMVKIVSMPALDKMYFAKHDEKLFHE